MNTPLTTQPHRTRLEEFFESVDPSRGRLIFALDATASRQPTWDAAAELTGQMFATVAAIGSLDVQLVYLPRSPRMRCVALAVRRQMRSLRSCPA